MPPRRCLKCNRPFTGARCPEPSCSSREARGYGAEHQQARGRLAALLPAPCGYCREIVQVGERFDAAHVIDGAPEYGWRVAHPSCNQRAKVAESTKPAA